MHHPTGHGFSKSASSRIILADLPPILRHALHRIGGTLATAIPARVEPVKDIISISGCCDMASPTVGPSPLTKLKTPAGTPASSRIQQTQGGIERGNFRRLQHHCATGSQRRCHFAGNLIDRPIPRRNQTAYTDRLFADLGRAAHFFKLIFGQRLAKSPNDPCWSPLAHWSIRP